MAKQTVHMHGEERQIEVVVATPELVIYNCEFPIMAYGHSARGLKENLKMSRAGFERRFPTVSLQA